MENKTMEITDINFDFGFDLDDEAIEFETDVDSDNYGFVNELYVRNSYAEAIIECEDNYDGKYILVEYEPSHGRIVSAEMYDSYDKAKKVFIKNQG
jgi:hypothetical protein